MASGSAFLGLGTRLDGVFFHVAMAACMEQVRMALRMGPFTLPFKVCQDHCPVNRNGSLEGAVSVMSSDEG